MKPFVVYIKSIKDDNVTLTKDEFEQCIQEAYDKGYADGKADTNKSTTITLHS